MSSLMDTNVFDYVNVLDKALDASALRHEAISKIGRASCRERV